MTPNEDSALKKKIVGEFPEQKPGVEKLVKTLVTSFLKSDSDYGAITDIKADINHIYSLVRDYVSGENLDVYALKLDDRILLSRTNIGFEEIYEVVKGHSVLQLKKNMIEVWDDGANRIIHLIILPLRKHFPIEYSDEKERERIIERFISMSWQV